MATKKRYTSKYTDKPITDAQFLVDNICERIAAKEKKVLTYKYWNDPAWKKTWLAQIKHANQLLKEVTCLEIIAFLKTFKGQKIYSLGLKKPILEGAKNTSVGLPTFVEFEAKAEDNLIIDDIPPEESAIAQKSLWSKLS